MLANKPFDHECQYSIYRYRTVLATCTSNPTRHNAPTLASPPAYAHFPTTPIRPHTHYGGHQSLRHVLPQWSHTNFCICTRSCAYVPPDSTLCTVAPFSPQEGHTVAPLL